MKEELQETFRQDYPELCRKVSFETGDGWYDLLRDLFAQAHAIVQKHGDAAKSVTFTQIKEKFGNLTAYFECGPSDPLREELWSLAHLFGELSLKVCERCGEPGSETTDQRWVKVYCIQCKRQQDRK